jgi:hypothetical protein
MLVMFSAAVPVLLRVTDCGALELFTSVLGKVSVVGESVTAGIVAVPFSVAICVAGDALSVTVMLAVGVPDAIGVKTTVMVQLAPTASDDPQVLLCE